jgi:transglutaminase-like putative cysteine protease
MSEEASEDFSQDLTTSLGEVPPVAGAFMELPPWLQSPEEIPGDVAEMVRWGNLERARVRLADLASVALQNPSSATLARALLQEEERLRRLQREYSLSGLELLEKIQPSIPSVTATDLDNWRGSGELNHAMIDGQLRYHRREPHGLWRLSEEASALKAEAAKDPEAARRRGPRPARPTHLQRPTAPTTSSLALQRDPSATSPRSDQRRTTDPHNLDNHIAQALRAAAEEKTTEVLQRRFAVRHEIRVLPGKVPPGKVIRCWMPIPRDMRREGSGPQSGPLHLRSYPGPARLSSSDAPMATAYLEQPAAAVGEPTLFWIEYEYETSARVPLGDASLATSAPLDLTRPELAESLTSRSLLLPIEDPVFLESAWAIAGNNTPPLTRAWRIWAWIDAHVRWVPEFEYAVLTRIPQKALELRQADCGVQTLLFITLCRAVGIPARWQSGWVTRPGNWNLHDWAEIHLEPWGWIPVDPSFGRRRSNDPAVRDFFFGHLDSYRMVANRDFARPFDPPKDHWPSDPIDNQRGEVEWSGGNLYYDHWSYTVHVRLVNPQPKPHSSLVADE